jgi:hypothetical protein
LRCTAPNTVNTSANVPTNSATDCSQTVFILLLLRTGAGGCP